MTKNNLPGDRTVYCENLRERVMSAGQLVAILNAAPADAPVFVGEAEQEITEITITPRGVSLTLSLLGWGHYRGGAGWEESEKGRVAKSGQRQPWLSV